MIIDSHCHLDYFAETEIEEILARAAAAGVTRMVTIGTSVPQAAAVRALVERFPQVWGTVGVHPHRAAEGVMPSVEELVALADHPRIIGLGESGLDYFYDKSPREVQQEGFRRHCRAARESRLPLAIHAREADDDITRILAEERAGGAFPFLLHCFSSTPQLADSAVEMGGYISFSGILTFPKSAELREVAARLPLDRLLLETDSPYLAPVPLRGKRCEPGFTAHTAKVLAECRGVSVEEIGRITSENFHRLYPKAT
ncbi:TatD family hydrolase [Roseococcus sp. SDR]|uniref:TatD family hydrolase n=1 Tax=Roseococcus sp. SDR TaxID=2835532 RepID=UPI001BD0590B|nr:TatD family hydrolase [Roseococcus sp. SDR]MBS7791449.1 TatD family hydrolase [Roseococcus sp. SDR]MBV1846763.1 TatD family hydrolase [Roseococcus sp. SDR]